MSQKYQPVIGLEVHAALETQSKMFCDCPVVDSTIGKPNSAVCPVCSGMPGVLPVANRGAIEYALRVALALECQIALTSIFARKSYFYPDLPKGYQISQYEQPLAVNGKLRIETSQGEEIIRVRRVHIEEDTGKLTHVHNNGESYSLVDLNRSGVPLLEIVSEPDLHSAEAVRAYAMELRSILRYLGVNSGDLEKGTFRIEPNISLRPMGSQEFGTRVEIKNLNSFRALERGVAYEIERQSALLDAGKSVVQQTLGWDDVNQVTVPQRSKEDAEDYRYFPEPDLPPLVIEEAWLQEIAAGQPELPYQKRVRFQQDYGLSAYDTEVLTAERQVAEFFEATLSAAGDVPAKRIANWITGDLFNLLKQQGQEIGETELTPAGLAELIQMVGAGEINQKTAKGILAEMLETCCSPRDVVESQGLAQISDQGAVAELVADVLAQHPEELSSYLGGKDGLKQWFFGQVMRAGRGKANPQVVQAELERQLGEKQAG